MHAVSVRETSKKAGSSSRNKSNRTPGKHRGPKKYTGQYVEKGMILYRQLGLKYYPGENVRYKIQNEQYSILFIRGCLINEYHILVYYPW